MLDLNNVDVEFKIVAMRETKNLPKDAKQEGTTWTYANKDGTPDRRYNINRKIPIMLYGQIHWKSMTGLNESFQFSNAEAAAGFIDALTDFRATLRETS